MAACALTLLLFSCVVSIRFSQAYIVPENAVLDTDRGEWSRFFDVDDAWGAEAWGNRGDNETHAEIYKRRGKSCLKSIPCYGQAEAMDIQLSPYHFERYPDADINEIMKCTEWSADSLDPDIGFSCTNKDQVKPQGKPEAVGASSACKGQCKKNGQFDIFNTLPDNNCFRCANFKVRYFCLYDNYNCEKAEGNRGDTK